MGFSHERLLMMMMMMMMVVVVVMVMVMVMTQAFIPILGHANMDLVWDYPHIQVQEYPLSRVCILMMTMIYPSPFEVICIICIICIQMAIKKQRPLKHI